MSSDPQRRRGRDRLRDRVEKVKKAANTKQLTVSIGPKKLTRFEKARLVGERVLQVAMGARATRMMRNNCPNIKEMSHMKDFYIILHLKKEGCHQIHSKDFRQYLL